jgi:uncharacterized membrane protein required for colicin V production
VPSKRSGQVWWGLVPTAPVHSSAAAAIELGCLARTGAATLPAVRGRPAAAVIEGGPREARMSIEDIINSIHIFDLVVILFLVGMFVLGYVQGVIRRLIGIASIAFAFIVAAQARDPLGGWLAINWTQFPSEYSRMIGFGVVFATISIGLALIAQLNYKTMMLWPKTPIVEEIIGGILGVVQGLIILLAVIIIVDPYFVGSGGVTSPNELPLLRAIHDQFEGSVTAAVYRSTLIPGFLAMFGVLVPDTIEAGLQRGR